MHTTRDTLSHLNTTLRELAGSKPRHFQRDPLAWVADAIRGDHRTPPVDALQPLYGRDPETFDELRIWLGAAAWAATDDAMAATDALATMPDRASWPFGLLAWADRTYMPRATDRLAAQLPEIIAHVAKWIAAIASKQVDNPPKA